MLPNLPLGRWVFSSAAGVWLALAAASAAAAASSGIPAPAPRAPATELPASQTARVLLVGDFDSRRGVLAGELRAGQEVELRWGAVPASAREMELVLSLDGGRNFNVHITPQLDPRTGRRAWRVPNLPAERACIALRAGSPGEEYVVGVTAAFRITGDRTLGRASIGLADGFVWNGIEDPAPAAPHGLSSPGASLETAQTHVSAEIPPRGPALGSEAASYVPAEGAPVGNDTASSARAHASPRYSPLRN